MQFFTNLGPGNRGHTVLGPQIAELSDLARARAPQVHARAEADGEDVQRGPVDKVEVEVVLQCRGVEHLEGNLGDLALCLPGARQEVLARATYRRKGEALLHVIAERLPWGLELEKVPRRAS